MCDPLTAGFMVISAGTGILGASASADAAADQARAAYRQADAYHVTAQRTKTEASQNMRARLAEFEDAQAQNNVAIAASGFTPGSFRAPMEENRRRAMQDADRISRTGTAQADQQLAQAGEIRQGAYKTAKAQSKAAAISAFSSTINAGFGAYSAWQEAAPADPPAGTEGSSSGGFLSSIFG